MKLPDKENHLNLRIWAVFLLFYELFTGIFEGQKALVTKIGHFSTGLPTFKGTSKPAIHCGTRVPRLCPSQLFYDSRGYAEQARSTAAIASAEVSRPLNSILTSWPKWCVLPPPELVWCLSPVIEIGQNSGAQTDWRDVLAKACALFGTLTHPPNSGIA